MDVTGTCGREKYIFYSFCDAKMRERCVEIPGFPFKVMPSVSQLCSSRLYLLKLLVKTYFFFIFGWFCIFTSCVWGSLRRQDERIRDSLELGIQGAVSCLTWVPRTKLRSCGRRRALCPWAISLAQVMWKPITLLAENVWFICFPALL